MSIIGFKKSLDGEWGGWGELYPSFFLDFLNFLNFAKPLKQLHQIACDADSIGTIPSSRPFTRALKAFITVGHLPFPSEWANKWCQIDIPKLILKHKIWLNIEVL